jgi:hypothetical protein
LYVVVNKNSIALKQQSCYTFMCIAVFVSWGMSVKSSLSACVLQCCSFINRFSILICFAVVFLHEQSVRRLYSLLVVSLSALLFWKNFDLSSSLRHLEETHNFCARHSNYCGCIGVWYKQ